MGARTSFPISRLGNARRHAHGHKRQSSPTTVIFPGICKVKGVHATMFSTNLVYAYLQYVLRNRCGGQGRGAAAYACGRAYMHNSDTIARLTKLPRPKRNCRWSFNYVLRDSQASVCDRVASVCDWVAISSTKCVSGLENWFAVISPRGSIAGRRPHRTTQRPYVASLASVQ
jgi:hypothetical protein